MARTLTVIFLVSRALLELAELAVHARRATNQAWDQYPWRRPGPWFGDRGAPPFWQGR